MPLQIWIPNTAERRRLRECTTCGRLFPDAPEQRRKFERHVIRCAEVNEEEIAAEYEAAQANPYEGMDYDTRGEYLELREKARREGVIGKGLNTPAEAAKGKVR